MSEEITWARLEGEPAMWYDRFRSYYLILGPTRTLTGAYKAFCSIEEPNRLPEPDDDGKIRVYSTPNEWNEACDTYRWYERALAYDAKLYDEGGVVELARETIHMATLKAAETLILALQNPRLQVAAAKEILDRGGLPATSAHIVKGVTFTADEMAKAAEELSEWQTKQGSG